jgi:pimeloyl-ACP methyl ester carboxylesterase
MNGLASIASIGLGAVLISAIAVPAASAALAPVPHTSESTSTKFLAPQFASVGYRVITTDLRGLGESSTGWSDYTGAATGSDIVALLRELHAGPANLIGQSNSAGAVVWAAADAPDLVRSVTLIGPFVREIPPASFSNTVMTWGMINLGLARPWGVSLWGTYPHTEMPEQVGPAILSFIAH